MDVNYNDGRWYGWNGGECPVHVRTFVDAVWQGSDGSMNFLRETSAGRLAFLGSEFGNLIAFRVVKEYRQPRELWHLLDLNGDVYNTFDDIDDAKREHAQRARFTLVHYREVMDGAE